MTEAVNGHKLNGRNKATLLLISLGPELSSAILKHLDSQEVEQLTADVMKVRNVPPKQREEVLAEFCHTATYQEQSSRGGMQFARRALEQAVGSQRAQDLITRLAEAEQPRPFRFLADLDPAQVATLLSSEHPQIVALFLSQTGTSTAAAVISHLPPRLQTEVALRIAKMERFSTDMLADLEAMLMTRLAPLLQPNGRKERQTPGGLDHLVSVLKNVDRGTERDIIEVLDEKEPPVAEEVKRRMFVFDNITTLDDRSLQRVLREVDFKDLGLALKNASEEVKERIHANMSTRAVEMLEEDIAAHGPVRLKHVEEAQGRIVNVIRRLEEAEEIIITRGGEDDIVT